jgi:cytochrome c553
MMADNGFWERIERIGIRMTRKYAKKGERVLAWLRGHAPARCEVCHGWGWRGEAQYEQALTGQIVAMCPRCHESIFNPISGYNKN